VPIAATVTTNSQALWYLTRGFGLVALVLLTASMVLGLMQTVRFARPGWPRFVVSGLHKNVSLLALVVLTIHVVTALLDSYAPIRLVDVFVPFVSQYRPVWMGLGALSLDLMIAVLVTSLLRERIGLRTWRAVHWTAYACWPLAIVHGLGTGSDTKLGWVLALNAACAAAVLLALWWRLASGWSLANAPRRGIAVAASIALPVAAVAWTVAGPLRAGWARRAGTPAALLGTAPVNAAASAANQSSGSGAVKGRLVVPFRGSLRGTQQESGGANQQASVTIVATVSGSQPADLRILLVGRPRPDGGVQLASSQVALGPPAQPDQLQGQVSQLEGSTIVAALRGDGNRPLTATIQLQLTESDALSGTIEVVS
jgi:Ferric reductase like transmembrane component